MPTEILIVMLDIIEVTRVYRPIRERRRWVQGVWQLVGDWYALAGGSTYEPDECDVLACLFCPRCEPGLEPDPACLMGMQN